MWRRNGRNARRDKDATSKIGALLGRKPNGSLGWRQSPQDTARYRGLAAAALADQGQSFPAPDCEADVLHGAHLPGLALQETATNREFLKQAVDLEYGHAVASACAVSAIA